MTSRCAEPHSTEDLARLHATVHGYVQGVGFRYFVVETAQRLQLVGWVCNLGSGAVETVAEGTRSSLEELLAALGRGPRGARVSRVDAEWPPPTGEFGSFGLRHR